MLHASSTNIVLSYVEHTCIYKNGQSLPIVAYPLQQGLHRLICKNVPISNLGYVVNIYGYVNRENESQSSRQTQFVSNKLVAACSARILTFEYTLHNADLLAWEVQPPTVDLCRLVNRQLTTVLSII